MPDTAVATQESIALLALASLGGVGYRTLYSIFKSGKRFQDLVGADSVKGLSASLKAAGVRQPKAVAERIFSEGLRLLPKGEALLADLNARNIRLLHHFEPEFPPMLKGIGESPGWLFAEGDWRLLCRPSVAVVGTRKSDVQGTFLTQCVCWSLAGMDVCTVSGLAEGIDREAHYASLDAKLPTIAVLGTGINNQYPASSADVRRAILEAGGCVVSEYMPADPPDKKAFVWRNRIQAGLSRLTIPAQWEVRSGTARTVGFALEYGRPVVGVTVPFADTPEGVFLKEKGMQVFTLPMQSEDLRKYVSKVLE